MRVLAVFTVVCLLLVGLAEAKVYTLQECIELAKKSSYEIINTQNAVKTARDQVWVNAGAFLPSVTASGSYSKQTQGPTSGRLYMVGGKMVRGEPTDVETIIKNYDAGVRVGYTLFNGFANVWDYLSSKATKRAADNEYVIALSDVIYGVKTQYYYVLKFKRDLEVAREAVGRSQELLKLFQEKYDLGSASLSDVLKQKVQFGTDQLTAVTNETAYMKALDDLMLLIGIQPGADFEIADMTPAKEELGDLSTYINRALESHPTVIARRETINSAKYGLRSAVAQYMPQLNLSYSYGWGKNTFEEISKFGPLDHSAMIGISLDFSIFDGFQKRARVGNAKALVSNARALDLQYRNLVVRDIRDAYRGINEAEEKLKLTDEKQRAAKEDMDLVQAKYNLGAAALWELLDAQVSLKRAQFDRVSAEFDYNLAQAKLQNAMGE